MSACTPLAADGGCIIINRDVTGWHSTCSLLGWYDLLLTRFLHVSPLLMAFHVVKVHVMCVCSVEGICGNFCGRFLV